MTSLATKAFDLRMHTQATLCARRPGPRSSPASSACCLYFTTQNYSLTVAWMLLLMGCEDTHTSHTPVALELRRRSPARMSTFSSEIWLGGMRRLIQLGFAGALKRCSPPSFNSPISSQRSSFWTFHSKQFAGHLSGARRCRHHCHDAEVGQ